MDWNRLWFTFVLLLHRLHELCADSGGVGDSFMDSGMAGFLMQHNTHSFQGHNIVPMKPSGYLTLPKLPVGLVNFQGGANFSPSGGKNKGFITLPKQTPVNFVHLPPENKIIHPGGKPAKDYAIGLVTGGGMMQGPPHGPIADPVHHLPMNHLFVPIPVINGKHGMYFGPIVADILIVIDASKNMGHIDKNGVVVWNPAVVNFLDRFITLTPMGPKANRIGVVVVSIGIDDMIPLTHDRKFLLNSLNNLRPTFRGGCTEKGISTASSLFYQYGRRMAVKRIVLLTDAASKCPYRSMAELSYARKCGIDVIHVGFGPNVQPEKDTDSHWVVPGIDMLPEIVEPVAKRAYIAPIHGGWSPWSDWNQCSASQACKIGYQMRFRLCDNPKPAFGGQNCKGYPAVTRICHLRPCIDVSIGQWTRWTEFTPCSAACGVGTQSRSRTCITLNGEPSASCQGKYVDVQECFVQECPVDGQWSLWSEWGLCSQSCGKGIKMRVRNCDNPSPRFGGMSCQGFAVEEGPCDTGIPCPIDGGFGPWYESGQCDAKCGIGRLKFMRECNDPVPQYGGRPCEGPFVKYTDCNTGTHCPIPGGWGMWSEFSFCSVKCGVGLRSRQRVCDNPPPQYGGPPCEGPSIDEQNCDTGIPCPIDGHWSPWSEFTPCKGQCGIGISQRFRLCNNPVPMNGGKDCIGFPIEEKKCDTGVICPVDGGWSHWSEYSRCSVDCGRGIMRRFRECTNPVPQYGGAKCVGLDREESECDTGVSCPVHGYWSPWLPWGACSASCETGFRQRMRLCNNPSPKFGGLECEGSPIEEDTCDTKVPCPVHGGWSEWSPPMHCSVKCGVGVTKRVRECNSPPPSYGGNDCKGPDIEISDCDTGVLCPINGGWSLWSKWTACDVKCGTSVQQRSRVCDNPAPMYGGLPCDGFSVEERPCDSGVMCPIHGQWGLWLEWSKCSEHCGIGIQIRQRHCDSPAPNFGGSYCEGPDNEEIKCDTGIPCPIDGGWSPWSGLSSCSVKCGVGTMYRTRVCNNPPPKYNGEICYGPDTEELMCDTGIECPINGNWGPWSDFTLCNVNCGVGVQARKRLCDSPAPMYGGELCYGPEIEEIPCDTGVFCPVDGQWGPWSEFTQCSKQCGVSIIHRKRVCDNPMPMYGGKDCIGIGIEEQICDTGIACPIDGSWGHWSEFTACSAKCGIGVQQRSRECDSPPPKYGGGYCEGVPLESRECDTGVPCPIHGGWTPWTDFGPCNVECGAGIHTRERECTNPIPMYGGLPCEGYPVEEKPCDTGVPCAVHGGWTLWSEWSACSVKCGAGTTMRTRECSNPPPLYGGLPCKGVAVEEQVCDTGIFCPVDGQWGMWSEFMPCSVACGVGIMQRTRECDSPVPQYGGKMCMGDNIENKHCDTGIPCPIDGGFSVWAEWSVCSAECGEGLSFRTRECNSPAPMYGGAPCKGIFKEERVCDTGVFCPVHGNWGEWSPFTRCSVGCGVGVKERSRLCDSPFPMYGGKFCEGIEVEVVPCDTGIQCPVHGGWTIWTLWSKCSAVCGVGLQTRSRKCSNPVPQFGGKPCIGEEIQEQVCNSGIACPVDGGWGFWSDWQPCDAKCGVGMQRRLRVCDSPPPQFGGKKCIGPDYEEMICDTGIPCAVSGNWSPWSAWLECSVSCGIGMTIRIRTCSDPPPMYGGELCPGEAEQIQKCDTEIFCPVDGHWSLWSKWTPCSASCGIGIHGRSRTCTNPPPEFGGNFCVGPPNEKAECDSGIPCPIDGNWTPWSEFGVCNVKCGIGVQTRIRECSDPPPQFGGNMCFGDNSQDRPCNTGVYCPVNGGWTEWTAYGNCGASCGMGMQERSRKCSNPPAQYGGMPCEGPDIEIVPCDSGVPCPVHGQWSEWYQWSHCLADCGIGKRERARECNNPKPMFGGLPCEGFGVMIEDCDTGIHCPIPGGWSEWSLPTPCSVSCGIGTQIRGRTCTNPPPQFGGMECVGPGEEVTECDTATYCPVNGQWGPWTEYGACNTKCGPGLQTRTRLCNMPAPQYGGLDCVGLAFEEIPCESKKACPIHGGWSFWSPWSNCAASCGMGERMRVRECNNPSPLYGGIICKGANVDVEVCDTGKPCPVDGHWTEWTPWEICSAQCGIGRQNRYRKCAAPEPQYGGLICPGMADETRECATGKACPIDGNWTPWSLWTACSESCGDGVRMRQRFCDDPAPLFGGAPCKGPEKEMDACSTGIPCPVHGQWSPWASWSKCLGDCAMGTMIRNRACTNPKPMYGGMECAGPSEEVMECDTGIPCSIHGNWGHWAPWSKCSVSCGIGQRIRSRVCDNPPPQFGGEPCKGFAEELEMCDTLTVCPIDGNWSPWSEFTMCSVPCGIGVQMRSRECNNPPPQYGGAPCLGPAKEEISCDNKIPCPIDGNWGDWYPWSKCNVPCGVGEVERHRDCNNPIPMYGGLPCEGPEFQTAPCDTKIPCHVDGNWGAWSGFSQCSASCGIGSKERVRVCDDPPPQFGGKPCEGIDLEIIECDSGIPCPIHGQWGVWSPWQKCSAECGIGLQIRERYCDSPMPQFGGLDCAGKSIEEQPCDTLRPCVINGGWSFWSPWSDCSETCAMGVMTRVRECTNPVPLYGGLFCDGPGQETKPCDSGVPCPIHGQWGPWYEWSKCMGKCGMGVQERTRECDSPPPQYGGMPCKGPKNEVSDCDTMIKCSINGHWAIWSPWNECSTSCGLGLHSRFRTCSDPPPAFGGLPCKGFAEEIKQCDTGIVCEVHGNWGMWSEFSPCSVKCGVGFKDRFRMCDNPKPSPGGMPCEGPSIEKVECDTHIACPVHGSWSMWSQWTVCDAACGFGIQERWRQCTDPPPMHGGNPCKGPQLEIVDCDTKIPCPVDGNWSPWSKWDICSVSCGMGKQIRVRTCSNPRPAYGGQLCVGVPEEVRECHSGVECSIDGSWAMWSAWTECDAKCGLGQQVRIRTCTDPKPMFGGELCYGIPEETRVCDSGLPCSVDGGWSFWSEWSACEGPCGKTVQTRVRTCTNPRPQFGGASCFGPDLESRGCVTDDVCVIEGSWGHWTEWDECKGKCGMGMRHRYRYCDDPVPMNGGSECKGIDTIEENCYTGTDCFQLGGWSMWTMWSLCSVTCGGGYQFRERMCNNPVPIGPDSMCEGLAKERRKCEMHIPCTGEVGWTEWSSFSKCQADCSKGPEFAVGYKTRKRLCKSQVAVGYSCEGPSIEKIPCENFPSCLPEWSMWTKWSKCSAQCGPGVSERTRFCSANGRHSKECVGKSRESVPCQVLHCPETPINCSTECKWDNGIGYAMYPGDCSVFVQCESIDGEPMIHDCPYGLLWSLDVLQCVYPSQSECDMCSYFPGERRPYHISCRGYWDCTDGALPVPKCCALTEKFDPFTNKCVPDIEGICNEPCAPEEVIVETKCVFRESTLGSTWYEQEINGVWQPRPCSEGTVFSQKDCMCVYYQEGFLGPKQECKPSLHLKFNSYAEDVANNPGIHLKNVRYLGDGTAYFDGTAAISDNIFSNSEWGQDVFVNIKLKPEGVGRNQGLIHNSGCGPSDIGPSVFIGLDKQKLPSGQEVIDMKFATVPLKQNVEYDFINITTPADKTIDAWFKFGKGQFEADVNGLKAQLNIPGASEVARRHGSLNIGGNLCQIGNESFGGFVGILDEVIIYKCRPKGH